MFARSSHRSGGGIGLGWGLPRDLIVLAIVLFVTLSLRFLSGPTAVAMGYLGLTPAVWRSGFLWQAVTYPFIGAGAPGIWFLLEIVILLQFGPAVFWRLGRRAFWRRLLLASGGAAVVAIFVDILQSALGTGSPYTFQLMQGQLMVLTVLVALFATLEPGATIRLLFILPIEARWFLPLEVVLGFFGYLQTGDLAGFLGIAAAVGIAWASLQPAGAARIARKAWLRVETAWIRMRLAVMRRRRGFRVVRGDGGEGGGEGGGGRERGGGRGDRWIN